MNQKLILIIVAISLMFGLGGSFSLKAWLFWNDLKNLVFKNSNNSLSWSVTSSGTTWSWTNLKNTSLSWPIDSVSLSWSLNSKSWSVNIQQIVQSSTWQINQQTSSWIQINNNLIIWNTQSFSKDIVYSLTTGFPVSSLIKNWMIVLTIFNIKQHQIKFVAIPNTLLVADANGHNKILGSFQAQDIKVFLENKFWIKIDYLENSFETAQEIDNFYTNIIAKDNYVVTVNWQRKSIANKDSMIFYANGLSFYEQKDMQEFQVNLLKNLYISSLTKLPADGVLMNKDLITVLWTYKNIQNWIDFQDNSLNAIDRKKTLFDTALDYQWIPWIYYITWNDKWFAELKQTINSASK